MKNYNMVMEDLSEYVEKLHEQGDIDDSQKYALSSHIDRVTESLPDNEKLEKKTHSLKFIDGYDGDLNHIYINAYSIRYIYPERVGDETKIKAKLDCGREVLLYTVEGRKHYVSILDLKEIVNEV